LAGVPPGFPSGFDPTLRFLTSCPRGFLQIAEGFSPAVPCPQLNGQSVASATMVIPLLAYGIGEASTSDV